MHGPGRNALSLNKQTNERKFLRLFTARYRTMNGNPSRRPRPGLRQFRAPFLSPASHLPPVRGALAKTLAELDARPPTRCSSRFRASHGKHARHGNHPPRHASAACPFRRFWAGSTFTLARMGDNQEMNCAIYKGSQPWLPSRPAPCRGISYVMDPGIGEYVLGAGAICAVLAAGVQATIHRAQKNN
jgi:hypothetical protein